MSRTVADATRFTATSPHAYSKPSSILCSANTIFPSSSSTNSPPPPRRPPPPAPNNNPSPTPPPKETPQQKVARLRALRAAEKQKPLSLWNRTVLRGRKWADIAHRTTALSLMGLTVVAGVITAFSLTDMLLYNRQQRTLFFATQTALYNETLSSAIAAQQSGRPLTEEETQVWNREKAVLQAEAEQEKRKALGWRERLFGSGARAAGAKEEAGKETMEGEKETLVDLVRGEGEEGVEGSKGVAVQPVGEVVGQGRVMQALQEKRRAEEGAFQGDDAVGIGGGGGQLDRVAEEAVEKGKQEVEKAKKGGWGSWFGGNR